MASNFEFLAAHWPMLAKIGEFAEKNLYDDPNTTLIKLRLLSEKIAACMLEEEKLPEPPDHSQATRIKLLHDHGMIPPTIKDLFYRLKNVGNRAAHDGYDSAQDAQDNLEFMHNVAAWFAAVYAGQSDAVKLPFALPPRRNLSAELDRLRQEHERALEELAQVKTARVAQNTLEDRKIASLETVRRIEFTERQTRQLLDERLRECGWEADTSRLKWPDARPNAGTNRAIAEWPVGHCRADYALFLGLRFVGIIEAKRFAEDASAYIETAKTYARLATLRGDEQFVGGPWSGCRVPFLFAANGREFMPENSIKSGLWFLDARKPTNHPAPIRGWFSPNDLEAMLKQRDAEQANAALNETAFDKLAAKDGLALRDYQIKAIQAVEQAIRDGKRQMLVTMATGTGKTRTAIGLIYRLIEHQRFRRILFVVDREALGEQAFDNFKNARMEQLMQFTDIYDVKGLAEKIPEETTKAHICTVQSLVRRVVTYDAERGLPRPGVGQYDCIIVDEAHRGYLLDREMDEDDLAFESQKDYISMYRAAIEYFDAVRIGLTATPALHTTQIFGAPIYAYSFREAVLDGHLIDYDPPYLIETEQSRDGIHFVKDQPVEVYNRRTMTIEQIAALEDDVHIDVDGFNTQVITEPFNQAIARELVNQIDPLGEGKTLIFAVSNDHADRLVTILKDAYRQAGCPVPDDAIVKITGKSPFPLNLIARFKNEQFPNIVVTVDLLTTGVDVPKIVNLVFLRRVSSRMLYEQMLGRATRRCDDIGKDHFSIFDAVKLYDALQPTSAMTPVAVNPLLTFRDVIQRLRLSVDAEQQTRHVEALIAKLQRKRCAIETSDRRDLFLMKSGGSSPAEYIARLQDMLKTLPPDRILEKIQADLPLFELLDTENFQTRKQYISRAPDAVVSVARGFGKRRLAPGDYLEEFKRYLEEHRDRVTALTILCQRPASLTRQTLRELRLTLDVEGFTEKALNEAWNEITHDDALIDLITFVRHLAVGAPIVSHEERVRQAMKQVRGQKAWTPVQKKWLNCIEKQLLQENTLSREDFSREPFKRSGGFERINRIFNGELADMIHHLNEYLYEAA